MSYNTLENYYKTLFALTYHHKWPIDIEMLIPYERDIYVGMIHDHLEKMKEERNMEENKRKIIQKRGW